MVRCHCKSKKGTGQRRMSQNVDYQRSQSKRKIKIFPLHLILRSQQYYPDNLNELTQAKRLQWIEEEMDNKNK